MGKWLLALLVLIGAGLAALWALVHRPQQEALAAAQQETAALRSENARLSTEVANLLSKVADLQIIRQELQRAGADLQQKVSDKERELLALRGTQDDLLGALRQEIADEQVRVQRFRDQLRVDVVDEVLFDSGEAELKDAGKRVMLKLAAVLKKAEDRRIEVQGHTDDVPIVGRLAQRYATNWELSAARATNVVRFLQEAGEVAPARLSLGAFSQYQPRESNASDAGRRRNRRIEIVLRPLAAETESAGTRSAPPATTS